VRKSIALLSIFILTLSVSFAQFKRQREYSGFFDTYYYRGPITFTLGGALTNYRGDLTDGLGLNGLSYGFSVGANYKLWPHMVFGAEFSYLNLQAKDYNATRNLSFKTTGYEFQVYGRLYLIDEIVRVAPDRRKESHYTFCKPYIHYGIGALMFTPTLNYNNPTAPVPSIAGGSSIAMVIPAGLGLQFTITQRSSLCLEYVYRFTTTDYLDNLTFPGSKNDGYGLLQAKFQFAPTAPKRKKKLSLPPPTQYDGTKGTETWKTRKLEGQKNKPQKEENELPDQYQNQDGNNLDGENQKVDEQNPDNQNQEKQPAEEQVTPE
jgi:opacity protein-like surface antigen